MFGKLTETLEKGLVRDALGRGGLLCPDCGQRAERMPDKWNGALECAGCGTKASLSEWAEATRTGLEKGMVDGPPEGTKISKEGDGYGGTVWNIPASGKGGFFLFFAVFWLGIVMTVSGGFLFTILTGGKIEGDMPWFVAIPFFGVFYAVGLGVLYAGLRMKYMKHRLTVSGGEVVLRQEMFGRSKEMKLQGGSVKTVERKEFYRQNKRPVYGIEIKGEKSKLKFGSGLKDDEKMWLVADIREVIFGKPQDKGAATDGGLGTLKVRDEPRDDYFSVQIPGAGKAQVLGSMMFAIFGAGFLTIGFFALKGEAWLGFRGVWVGFSSLFVLLGLTALFTALRSVGQDSRIEGNSVEISLRTYKRGLVIKDRSFPRSEVTDIRSSVSGSSGNTPMKRVELIVGDEVVKLAKWMDGTAADALVAEVRAAL